MPFLHFFDGFRTSHEVNKIAVLDDAQIAALIREDDLLAFRRRGLTPEAPVVRGTAQNPDVFFQAREACNPYHLAVPGIVQEVFDELAVRTGRRYSLVEYHGAPDADRVVVVMGSGAGAVEETVDTLVAAGEKVGMLTIRLFQPFPSEQVLAALPSTVRAIAVLDRTKEPGAVGEPLYQAMVATLAEAMDGDEPPFAVAPRVIGGRYGLSSKEFTPAMIKPVFDELLAARPKRHFTVGIYDDVTHLSLPIDATFPHPRPAGEVQALFFGLGSDGTVGANKASVKIIGEGTDLFAQGYFVYDSKKSGCVTVSHLRFGPEPIRSTYLVDDADFVACHQFGLLQTVKVLEHAKPGATFLLNSPYGPDEVWDHLPVELQQQLVDKEIDLWVIDAFAVATEVGMGNRINTIMQPCFFHLSGVLPADEAIERIKGFVKKTYAKRGEAVVDRNFAAIDLSIERLGQVTLGAAGAARPIPSLVPDTAPDFVRRRHRAADGRRGRPAPGQRAAGRRHVPDGHDQVREAGHRAAIPIWDRPICIDCGKCAMVCPHAAIRMKVFPEAATPVAPTASPARSSSPGTSPTTGSRSRSRPTTAPAAACAWTSARPRARPTSATRPSTWSRPSTHRDVERERWDFFQSIAPLDRSLLPHDTVKGSQVLEPLFEFSGACGGCGETPYLRLVSQLFGDRMIVANATGCSSIYGANLPTTPWTVNAAGPRAGVGQLPVRGQRRVRPRHAPRRSTRRRASPGDLLTRAHSRRRRGPRPGAARQPAGDRAGDRRPARARGAAPRRCSAGVDGRARTRRPPAPRARARPRPPGRLDHRRRRLGLRHRLRRPGPGPAPGAT